MKNSFVFLLFIWIFHGAYAESFVYFQNNTSLAIQVSTTSTLSSSYWVDEFSGSSEAWRLQTRLYQTNRDQGITWGSDFFFTTELLVDGVPINLELKLTGNMVGSDMWHSISGPSFNHPWQDDALFHSETFTVNGKQFLLKYRADLPPGNTWYDIYYVLHEVDPYPIDTTELSDNHVLNVLAYNIFMLTPPIGSSDEYERSKHIHNHVHGYDALIISEAFYNAARVDNLIPLISAEYPYYTSVVDQAGSTEDGGVMIFSRWPILAEDQHIFTGCNGSDCFAAKGVKYAKIDKNGTLYHLFGTHTQAWTGSADIAMRSIQLAEVKSFIDGMNLPPNEAVLIGGDLNVDKIANHQNEYDSMFVTLSTSIPQYTGHPYTYDVDYNSYGSSGQEFLDYVLSETDHFAAYSSTNYPQILRTAASVEDLWDNNHLELDLSDHYAVHGRFVYPYFSLQPLSQTLCEGDSLELVVASNVNLAYQWFRNDTAIAGATSTSYSISNSSGLDAGFYYCIGTYADGTISSDTIIADVVSVPTPIIAWVGNQLISNAANGNQWHDQNGPINNATDSTYIPTVSGSYYVVVTENGCISDTSNVLPVVINSNPEWVKRNISYAVYPNPATDQVTISSSSESSFDLILTDMQGRILIYKHDRLKEVVLNTSTLNSGVYFLKLVSNSSQSHIKLLID